VTALERMCLNRRVCISPCRKACDFVARRQKQIPACGSATSGASDGQQWRQIVNSVPYFKEPCQSDL